MVYGIYFQIDDIVVYYQYVFWYRFQFQCVGGVLYVWIFMWDKWQLNWMGICCDDGVVEVDYGFVVFVFYFQGVSVGKFIQIVNYFYFMIFGYVSQIIGQLSDDFFFSGVDFVNVSFWFVENDVVFGQCFCFFDNFCYVQQCFRRDIIYVQINIIEGVVMFYDDGFQI